jgi:hypothetical protein
VTVAKGATATANFTLDSGLELTLSFAKTSVEADGFQVVSGTIKTSEAGQPRPYASVRLNVMPGDPFPTTVTTAPRAAICVGATRVWPTGTLSAPDGAPVDVTSDATGTYAFTLTVGTKPGTWRLDAWARDRTGKLSTDVTASETASITFTPLLPAGTLANITSELNSLKGTTLLQQLSLSTLTSTLAELTAQHKGLNLGGLAYADATGTDGPATLIFAADAPPVINSKGELDPALTINGNDLVVSQAEWTGTGLPAKVVNAASLLAVIRNGQLPDLPTLAEWSTGASVLGWKLIQNTMMVGSQKFQQFGWAYPGITTAGACY